MKKTNLFMFAAGIVLATANAPVTMAQKTQVEAITSSTLPVTRVTEGTDGTYNFRSFEVKASEAGSYYTEFWLLISIKTSTCITARKVALK